MLVNILLALGSVAVMLSWAVAVVILRSDKFAGTTTSQTPASHDHRTQVPADTTV